MGGDVDAGVLDGVAHELDFEVNVVVEEAEEVPLHVLDVPDVPVQHPALVVHHRGAAESLDDFGAGHPDQHLLRDQLLGGGPPIRALGSGPAPEDRGVVHAVQAVQPGVVVVGECRAANDQVADDDHHLKPHPTIQRPDESDHPLASSRNEVLCKFVCQNACCLIGAMDELGNRNYGLAAPSGAANTRRTEKSSRTRSRCRRQSSSACSRS
jgi:hypothetical protein